MRASSESMSEVRQRFMRAGAGMRAEGYVGSGAEFRLACLGRTVRGYRLCHSTLSLDFVTRLCHRAGGCQRAETGRKLPTYYESIRLNCGQHRLPRWSNYEALSEKRI